MLSLTTTAVRGFRSGSAMEVTEAGRVSKDILFRRIGVDLPLCEGSEAFNDTNAPVRGLAVSNRFGISIFVHSAGFVVTQTSNLVEVAQQAKDDSSGKTAKQGCYLNIPVSGVRILSLSRDELTLAACDGDQTVQFYDVPTLVHKLDKTPLEARDIPEGRVKDFRWSPTDDEIYLLLSREGHLYSGSVGVVPSRVVKDGVVAVSLSPDGKYVAYLTEERVVCICNSKCELQHTFNLPAEIGDVTENLQVESLQWVRSDSMLVSYTQTNEDEEEEECPLILVTAKDGDLSKEGGTVTGVFFDSTFPSIDSRVLPAGSGPYMLAEYIKPWEMAITASRRSVDDHIVILGWSSEQKEDGPFSIELINDSWLPRIELQENGDDNLLLGLAVGLTTTELQVTDPRDSSGDTILPPCPVLMCLSLGGKLSLFSMARLDESAASAMLVSPPSKVPESNRADSKSKSSASLPTKAPQESPVDKVNPGVQEARIRQVEERVEDEPSVSSGSETDSEGRSGSSSEVQKSASSAKDSSSVSAKDTSSIPNLQTPGAAALSRLLAQSGASNISSLSSAKSAPSGLDQLQQTGVGPQPPATLGRSLTQMPSFGSQISSRPQSTPFSSGGLKHSQSFGPGLFGQAGNDKGSGLSTSSFRAASSSSLSSAPSSGGLGSQQSSGFGFGNQAGDGGTSGQSASSTQPSGFGAFGQAVNAKGFGSQISRSPQPSGFGAFGQAGNAKGFGSQTSSSPQPSGFGAFGQAGNDKGISSETSSTFLTGARNTLNSASLSSGSLKPQQSSGFGSQAGNDKGSSCQTPSSPQPSGFGVFGQAGNDKGSSSSLTSSFSLPMCSAPGSLSSSSVRPQQSSGFGFGNQTGNDRGTNSQTPTSLQSLSSAPAPLSSGSIRPQQSSGFGFGSQTGNDKGTRAPAFAQKSSPLERGSQVGPQKFPASGGRTLDGSSPRPSGVSEPEQAFIVELEKIKKMADEVDNFMAYIEGKGQRTTSNQPPCFTKQSVQELELGTRTLADNCKNVKDRVEEERQSLNNLRDENLQVDAWRLYVQSLAEQAAENRHQELWSRRKLTPDLDVKRKRVTKAEQALKQQIAALEEHVHHLELDNRKRVVSSKGGKNNLNRQTSTGRSQSIQNLYSTVNGLLSSADRLSQQVTQQMEALNISAQSQISEKIMKSVGLSSEDTLHMQSRPSFGKAATSHPARQQLTHSPASKAESGLPVHSTPPRRIMPSDSGVGAPSVTRRRRDSMDGVQKALALAGGASPKTTIERVSHHTPSQQSNPSSGSSNMLAKHIRQRSFQESSEESTAPPRHVRRVLSSQTRSASSSPAPSTSPSPDNKDSSVSSGFVGNSTISSPQGSQPSGSLFERPSGDSRPDAKRASPRNAASFAEKSGTTLATRFGPPPGRTTATPSTAVTSSSTAAVGSSFGASPTSAPSESVFKFTNNNLPNAASSFSFSTPSVAKPMTSSDSSVSTPAAKPSSNVGTTQSSSTGPTFSITPNSVFGSAGSNTLSGSMSTTKLGSEGTNTDSSKSSVHSAKDAKPAFGFKAASFGTPSFGTPSFGTTSNPFSRSSFSGATEAGSTPSSTSFTLSVPANKVPGSREGDDAKQNDVKQPLPLTPTGQSTPRKATATPELPVSAAVSQTVSAPPPAAKPSIFGTPATTTVATPLTSQVQSGPSPLSLNVPASTTTPKPAESPVGNSLFGTASSTNAAASTASSQTPVVFPAASTPTPTFTVPPLTTPDTDEEDMDEEQVAGETTALGGFNLGGLGLGGSSPAPSQTPKTGLFGNLGTPFGTPQTSSAFGTPQTSSAFGTPQTSSAFGTPQTSSAFGTPQTSSAFGSTQTSSAFGTPQTSSAFGTPQTSSAFGAPQTSSAFGAQQSSSAFGAQQTSSPFGAQTSSPFGTQQTSSPFGTQQTSSAFGSQAASSAFGSQAASSTFGSQAASSAFGSQAATPAFGSSSPQGQLFRPPSFSLPSAQTSPPQTSGGFGGFGSSAPSQPGANPFGLAFGSSTPTPAGGNPFGTTPAATTPAFGSPAQPGAGGFGQPSQLGPGQKALGSALGTFGQTRQMGFGSTSPFGSTPSTGFGSAAGGGFGSAAGGGFASAGTGGGFASAGTGGGFASAATGSGFAGAASGGGFAGAASGGGFASAGAGGGFAGAAGSSGGGFAGVTGGGGFGAFGGNSAGGGGFGGAGQPAFGATTPPAQSLFTQMRK